MLDALQKTRKQFLMYCGLNLVAAIVIALFYFKSIKAIAVHPILGFLGAVISLGATSFFLVYVIHCMEKKCLPDTSPKTRAQFSMRHNVSLREAGIAFGLAVIPFKGSAIHTVLGLMFIAVFAVAAWGFLAHVAMSEFHLSIPEGSPLFGEDNTLKRIRILCELGAIAFFVIGVMGWLLLKGPYWDLDSVPTSRNVFVTILCVAFVLCLFFFGAVLRYGYVLKKLQQNVTPNDQANAKEESVSVKWCPFVRGSVTVSDAGQHRTAVIGSVGNGVERNPERARCMAGACMAWVDDGRGADKIPAGHCGLVRA